MISVNKDQTLTALEVSTKILGMDEGDLSYIPVDAVVVASSSGVVIQSVTYSLTYQVSALELTVVHLAMASKLAPLTLEYVKSKLSVGMNSFLKEVKATNDSVMTHSQFSTSSMSTTELSATSLTEAIEKAKSDMKHVIFENDLAEVPDPVDVKVDLATVTWNYVENLNSVLEPTAYPGVGKKKVGLGSAQLGQPVGGSSMGSTYYCVGRGKFFNYAARLTGAMVLSLRAEKSNGGGLQSKVDEAIDNLVEAGFQTPSGGHLSLHVSVNDLLGARRTIGSMLMASMDCETQVAPKDLFEIVKVEN